MSFVDEMRAKYPKPYYTLDAVVKEIKHHIAATYEEVAKNNFLEWPGFDFCVRDGVPQLEWEIEKEVSGVHWLLIPRNCGVDTQRLAKWFDEQGFEYCTNEKHRCMSWRIKF